MVKKIVSVLIIFLCINVVNASNVDVSSERYILYNMNDMTILDEKDSNSRVSIASLTKIMSVIVAIENIKDFEEKIVISNEMIKDIAKDVAICGFKENQIVTYDDLLYGAILSSGADAINALGYSISGNMDEFVKLMNNKTKQLGLKNTNFANAVGLYDKDNYSSAYDIAQILIYSLKNKKFKEIFETKKYILSNGKTIKSTLVSTANYKKLDVSYITGAKTGYIKAAGNCLATTATINDVDYLLVTLNAMDKTRTSHIKDSLKIYDYYSNNYGYINIVNTDDVVVSLDTSFAKEDKIDIKAGVEIKKYLKTDIDLSKIIYKYDGLNKIDIDTEIGARIGNIKIIYDNEVLDEFELIFNERLSISFFGVIVKILKYMMIVVPILFAFLIIRKKKLFAIK